jgi:hypothetical protein
MIASVFAISNKNSENGLGLRACARCRRERPTGAGGGGLDGRRSRAHAEPRRPRRRHPSPLDRAHARPPRAAEGRGRPQLQARTARRSEDAPCRRRARWHPVALEGTSSLRAAPPPARGMPPAGDRGVALCKPRDGRLAPPTTSRGPTTAHAGGALAGAERGPRRGDITFCYVELGAGRGVRRAADPPPSSLHAEGPARAGRISRLMRAAAPSDSPRPARSPRRSRARRVRPARAVTGVQAGVGPCRVRGRGPSRRRPSRRSPPVRAGRRARGSTTRDQARFDERLADLVVAHGFAVAVRLEHGGDEGPVRVAQGPAIRTFDEQPRPEPGRLQERVERGGAGNVGGGMAAGGAARPPSVQPNSAARKASSDGAAKAASSQRSS